MVCENFAKVSLQLYQGHNAFGDVENTDDSGFNAIRLMCSGGKELVSAEGVEGEWTYWKYTVSRKPIREVHIRSQRPGVCSWCGFFCGCDDTATHGLRFKDTDGKNTYEPYVGYSYGWHVSLKHRFDGYWAHAKCRSNPPEAVTGFRTQVEPDQGGGDDTGLNRVQFQCDYI